MKCLLNHYFDWFKNPHHSPLQLLIEYHTWEGWLLLSWHWVQSRAIQPLRKAISIHDHAQDREESMPAPKTFTGIQTCSRGLLEGMRTLLISLLPLTIPAAAAPLPMICELTSEEVPEIKVRLTERTAISLRGELIQKDVHLGTFQTGQSKGYGPVWWSFHDSHDAGKGISVLFKDNQHWNPHRRTPRPSETNRVLFVGFDTDLWNWRNNLKPGVFRGNQNLIKAAAGFWTISDQCLGGRMMRGWNQKISKRGNSQRINLLMTKYPAYSRANLSTYRSNNCCEMKCRLLKLCHYKNQHQSF